MIKQFKKAFTLTEVLVATFIGTIILGFIFVFLGDVMDNISESKNEISVMSNYLDFSNELNNYVDIYNSGSILIDNTEDTGSDLFIMKSVSGNNGVLLGVVNLDDYKLDLDNTTYKNTGLGFRLLSNQDIQDIDASTGSVIVYGYLFQKDNVYTDLNIKDLQISSYNSGSIHEIDLTINLDYNSGLKGTLWDILPKNNLIQLNFDI